MNWLLVVSLITVTILVHVEKSSGSGTLRTVYTNYPVIVKYSTLGYSGLKLNISSTSDISVYTIGEFREIFKFRDLTKFQYYSRSSCDYLTNRCLIDVSPDLLSTHLDIYIGILCFNETGVCTVYDDSKLEKPFITYSKILDIMITLYIVYIIFVLVIIYHRDQMSSPVDDHETGVQYVYIGTPNTEQIPTPLYPPNIQYVDQMTPYPPNIQYVDASRNC